MRTQLERVPSARALRPLQQRVSRGELTLCRHATVSAWLDGEPVPTHFLASLHEAELKPFCTFPMPTTLPIRLPSLELTINVSTAADKVLNH